MACVGSLWLRWGTLCSLLFFLFAQDTSWDCRTKDDLLTEMSPDVALPSPCTLDCTARTYRQILGSQDKPTVRFRDSYTENPEEYCWSTQVQCSPSQHLQSALILVPMDTSANWAAVGLQLSSGSSTHRLPRHLEPSLLPASCGLSFDVTELLKSKDRQPTICVKIVPRQLTAPRGGLRCPPFLATTWKLWNQGEG